MTEFEFERGEILTNLTLMEDHAQKFPCPYCMEKHASKIIGYAEEVALGKEGDEKEMEKLAEDAREWRRKIQGAKEHKHDHVKKEHVTSVKCDSKKHKEMLADCVLDGHDIDYCEQHIPCH